MPDFDVCVITPQPERRGRSHIDIARAALDGGASFIQLRDETVSDRALWEMGWALRRLTRERGATFVVNDRADIALAVEADGVHLGREDLPVESARCIMGRRAIIGASVADSEEARAAEAAGASYVSVGSIFSTASKPDAGAAIGPAAIAEIKAEVGLPVLAIGGINCDNVGAVIEAGADGVAVISAVADAEDMVAAVEHLRRLIGHARHGTDR